MVAGPAQVLVDRRKLFCGGRGGEREDPIFGGQLEELLGADLGIFPERTLAKVDGQRKDDDIVFGREQGIKELGAAVGDNADFGHSRGWKVESGSSGSLFRLLGG